MSSAVTTAPNSKFLTLLLQLHCLSTDNRLSKGKMIPTLSSVTISHPPTHLHTHQTYVHTMALELSVVVARGASAKLKGVLH